MKRIISISSAIILCLLTIASCDRNDDDDNSITVYLNQTDIPYDNDGVWSAVLTQGTKIISQDIVFSHSANKDWGTWDGFTASRNSDANDYSSVGFWPTHQYTAMPGGGISGLNTPYLVGYWVSTETKDILPSQASCHITYGETGAIFTPQQMYVTNTSYCYYTIKHGSPFSKKFTTGDYFKLLIYGVGQDNSITGPVIVNLADFTNGNSTITKEWEYVNLEALGDVKAIYFQMESSDIGKYGINTPTYFAIDRLTIKKK